VNPKTILTMNRVRRAGYKVLPPSALRLLAVLAGLREKLGYPPTLRQAARALGLASVNSFDGVLRSLRAAGLVSTQDASGRGRCLAVRCDFFLPPTGDSE
jgi:hypothetical protein